MPIPEVFVGYEFSSKKKDDDCFSCDAETRVFDLRSTVGPDARSRSSPLTFTVGRCSLLIFLGQLKWTTLSAPPYLCVCVRSTRPSNANNLCFATGRIRQLESVPDISALQHTEGLNKGHHASSGVHGSLPRSRSCIMSGNDEG